MGGRVDAGKARLGVVPRSPEGGMGGLVGWVDDVGVGVAPGRGAGVYSVVWLAVGAMAACVSSQHWLVEKGEHTHVLALRPLA